MTPPQHRAVIDAALRDWWLTADPTAPDLQNAAIRVELYLTSSGYEVRPDPHRALRHLLHRTVATAAVLSVLALGLLLAVEPRQEQAAALLLAAWAGLLIPTSLYALYRHHRARHRP